MLHNSPILGTSSLGTQWKTKDPFIFCAHHLDLYPGGNENLGPNTSLSGRNIGQDFAGKDGWNMYHGNTVPGFPVHPHSGFETVTIVKTGVIDHSDSLGSTGRFGDGDVQWMTAGKGVQHAEMFPLLHPKVNKLELFQLWMNLPIKSKHVDPHYKMLWNEDIPIVKETGSNGKSSVITIIAGSFNNHKALAPTPDSWASDSNNDVQIWTIEMDTEASITIPASNSSVHRTLYFYDGSSCSINEVLVESKKMIELAPDQEITLQNGNKTGYYVFLQAKPINEPVVQYGPFVASSKEALEETIQKYRETEFGGWPWSSSDPVNGKAKGRFSRLANGEEVIR